MDRQRSSIGEKSLGQWFGKLFVVVKCTTKETHGIQQAIGYLPYHSQRTSYSRGKALHGKFGFFDLRIEVFSSS